MNVKFSVTEKMIEAMITRAEFKFNESIIIKVSSQFHSTTIFLSMRSMQNEQTDFYPISGFPRSLFTEDTVKGMLCTF